MKCPFCMEEIADGSEKCSHCNSELMKPCPYCKEKIRADAVKCKLCGSMLDGSQPQQQVFQQNVSMPVSNPQPALKSQTGAAILCALLGSFGAHRFYIGPIWAGIVYFFLCWTGIPSLIAFIETYIIAFSSQETWARKYNNGVITPSTHIAVKILAAIFPIVFVVGILTAVAIPQFSAYRVKGYNSAAQSDLRNASTMIESYFADNQRYPDTLETSKFVPSKDVYVKCSILPDAYVCGAAHKQGTILYVRNSADPKISEHSYKAGEAIQLPFDPQPLGSAKADEYGMNNIAEKQQPQADGAMTFSPSFDCAKASSGAERMICSNQELAQADVALTQAYKAALSKSPNKAALKKEQGNWIRTKRDACSDAASMLKVYQDRTTQLLQ